MTRTPVVIRLLLSNLLSTKFGNRVRHARHRPPQSRMPGIVGNMAESEWGFDDPWPTVDDALEAAAVVAGKARELYGDELVEVLLYGSRARGDHCPESDLDILVVSKTGKQNGRDALCEKLNNSIYMDLAVRDWKWCLAEVFSASAEQVRTWDTTFYRNVRADSIGVQVP